MLKNFFFLNRLVNELNQSITGYTIVSVFSQEKDIFVFECKRDSETCFLLISVNPQFPYLTKRIKFQRAKKNVVNIAKEHFPARIMSVSIAVIDRIIKFELDKGEMYFFIMGNRTNVIVTSGNSTSGFKKAKDDKIAALLSQFKKYQYTSDYHKVMALEKYDTLKEYKITYPFLGNDILNEAFTREGLNHSDAINAVLEDVQNKRPALFTNEDQVELNFEGFRFYKEWDPEYFDNIFETINNYIYRKFSSERFLTRKKNIAVSLEKELEKTASKINNLKIRIESGSKEEEYNKIANLLLINLNSLRKGMEEIVIEDIYNNNHPLKIKLDGSLPPRKNADNYYEKARSEKINFEKSKELYKSSVLKYNKLKEDLTKLNASHSTGDLKGMSTEKNPQSGNDKEDLKNKFRQYIIDGKYRVYVGKDSEKNDLLTTRFAKQNDYWFHARSVSGSHVILRVENSKEPVPKPVLKKAAALAAFHSKAKTSSLAPVAYTLKKYVVKRKGMEIGKVSLLKEEVLLVKPEIPAGCEFISHE